VQLHLEQHVPAPVDDVLAALVDPAFLAALGALPKISSPTLLDQQRDGDRIVQRVRYRFTGDLSRAVTAVLDPAKLSWVDETTYDLAGRSATFRIIPDAYGDRLRCSGTHRFTAPPDGGTRRTVDGRLEVSYPLVGGRIERALASGLEEHLTAEAELLASHLAAG